MHAPFLVSNELLVDAHALRERMDREGYLFFRGVGPKDKIAAARADVIGVCRDAGWCDADGKWSGAGPFTEGEREYMDVYKRVIKLPSFLAVPEDAALMALMGNLVAGAAMLHRL